MNQSASKSISTLLQELRSGHRDAFDELLPLVYDELHRIAARQRQRWTGDETLDTTALIHEAYLKLADQAAPEWQNHAHFLGVASTAMRQILIDYARKKRAARRGGERPHVSLQEIDDALLHAERVPDFSDDLLIALDESLHRLAQSNMRQMRIVECRFFGGMSVEDTAAALGVSTATVKRGWSLAQAWLYRELKRISEQDA